MPLLIYNQNQCLHLLQLFPKLALLNMILIKKKYILTIPETSSAMVIASGLNV